MRTLQYLITLTVDDSDGPLSTEQIDAMLDHVHPTSTVVVYGSEPDEHFFIETIDVKEIEQDWISVKDRLPNLGEPVLIHYYKSGERFVTQAVLRDQAIDCASKSHPVSFWRKLNYGLTWYDDKRQIQSLTAKASKNQVTHWMSLPTPPEQ